MTTRAGLRARLDKICKAIAPHARLRVTEPFDPNAPVTPPVCETNSTGVKVYRSAKTQAGGLSEGTVRHPDGHIVLAASSAQFEALRRAAEEEDRIRELIQKGVHV